MNESIEELLASGAIVPDRPGSKRLVPAAPAPSSLAGGEMRELIDAASEVRDLLKATPAMNGREHIGVGLRFVNAIEAAQRALAALSPEAPARDGATSGRAFTLGEGDLFEIADILRAARGVKFVGSKDYALADEIARLIHDHPRNAALTPRHEAPADQTERWAKALYENNAFYEPDPDDAGWSDMAPNDGGIHDLHMDMARAAKSVWDRADEAPAEGAGERECLAVAIDPSLDGTDFSGLFAEGSRIGKALAAADRVLALARRSSAPEAREEAQPVAWRWQEYDHPEDPFIYGETGPRQHEEHANLTPLYTTPPAPEAEKLRVVVEALKPFAEIGSRYRTGGLRQDIENRAPSFMRLLDFKAFRRADAALAALQQEAK